MGQVVEDGAGDEDGRRIQVGERSAGVQRLVDVSPACGYRTTQVSVFPISLFYPHITDSHEAIVWTAGERA